jgi:hypothetical protein
MAELSWKRDFFEELGRTSQESSVGMKDQNLARVKIPELADLDGLVMIQIAFQVGDPLPASNLSFDRSLTIVCVAR